MTSLPKWTEVVMAELWIVLVVELSSADGDLTELAPRSSD